ncbi:MAG: hypothetical protein V3R25_10215 [Nitrosomonadaceae bacterium]
MAQILSNPDDLIADEMGRFFDDPLGFVRFSYDWDHGDLKGFKGPDVWQEEYLDRLAHHIRNNKFDGVTPADPVQMSTSSGHGIGKSALTAWLTGFIMSTRPFCKGVVTANTSPQLRTKTWAEIQKWNKRSLTGHWFDVTSGMQMKMTHKDHPESWRVDAQTCAKENSEAFAGLHAASSTPFYIFDEASAIHDSIWEVSEGGLTDGEPMWFVFGNPTRSSGRFFQCFNRQKHRWENQKIDSRKAKMTNKKKIQEWIDDYGEDSDFVRVRVRGEFPRSGSSQFISIDDVNKSMAYEAEGYEMLPKIIAVDVARFGDDQTVIGCKQGRKVWPFDKYRGMDTMETANKVAEKIREFKPDAVFVDGGGVGGGVIDRLKQLGHKVIEVNFGSSPRDKKQYANKRAEMYGDLRDALKAGLDIPDDHELHDELIAVEYGFNAKQQIQLEKKEDMKKRGLSSPDCGDTAALFFAEQIARAKPQNYSIPDAVNHYG